MQRTSGVSARFKNGKLRVGPLDAIELELLAIPERVRILVGADSFLGLQQGARLLGGGSDVVIVVKDGLLGTAASGASRYEIVGGLGGGSGAGKGDEGEEAEELHLD